MWYRHVSDWWPLRVAAVRRVESAFGLEVGGRVVSAIHRENCENGGYEVIARIPLMERAKGQRTLF
jgi:hypothetical protein